MITFATAWVAELGGDKAQVLVYLEWLKDEDVIVAHHVTVVDDTQLKFSAQWAEGDGEKAAAYMTALRSNEEHEGQPVRGMVEHAFVTLLNLEAT